MLVDVNELLLAEYKKLKYLAFSIKPINKHNLSLTYHKKEISLSSFVSYTFSI